MKGKIGLVVGLGVGYVLGTRAGRERYEQIKTQWLKVWHLDPVQAQVARAQDFAKSQAAAIPGALWNGAVKVVKAASESAPGDRLESAVDAAKDAAGDIADAAEETTEAVQKRAAAAKKSAAAGKSTANKSTAAGKNTATKSTPKNGS